MGGVVVGLLAVVVLGLVAAFSGKSASAVEGEGGGGAPPGAGPSGLRIRKITAETPTPSSFALKYSGDDDRWQELLAVNPKLRKVWPQFVPGLDPPATTPYGWGDTPDPDAPIGWGPSLLPWKIGEEIYLPSSWKGESTVAGFPRQRASSWYFDLYH